MLTKRIIACLDVKDGKVVKGINFADHLVQGDIVPFAQYYNDHGADELVFYDITASCENRVVDYHWIEQVASIINIPFCVAGGIRTLKQAEKILESGADKISINSPALENPDFISVLAKNFGKQCVVVGIDSCFIGGTFRVYQYTGNAKKSMKTNYTTLMWLQEVVERGAGEVVLNCMNQDGVKNGYDLEQLRLFRSLLTVPLIASGGAGKAEHFAELFLQTDVSGALAASVFHDGTVAIPALKHYLAANNIEVRCV